MARIKHFYIDAYTATTAIGPGSDVLWRGLQSATTGLAPCQFENADLDTWVGEVAACATTALPPEMAQWECRNNRLAELGLQQDGFIDAVETAKKTHTPARIGLFLGTSTSGIGATEAAYREAENGQLPGWFDYVRSHDYFSVCGYVRERLGLAGPAQVISTACSSSAKVFASAARAINAGFCDAAVVGGVDSLCLTTLYGFNSLQLVSASPCRPCDVGRDGISIGEAAGFALLTREPKRSNSPALLGWGESSDAHHMAAPDPQGRGAELAMQRALNRADLRAGDVDYINLHGTGTPANDIAECHAVAGLFGRATPVSSSKGWTGHTLGAAGIVEAVISLLCIENSWLPPSLNTQDLDPLIPAQVLMQGREQPVSKVLSNSFGFGGSNCSLVLGRV